MSDGTFALRWNRLDQRLLIPRLEELANEMQKRSIEATNRAAFDTRKSGNAAGYFPRLFEFQRQLTDQWAQKVYEVHCEVWRIQGNAIAPHFIRVVGKKVVTDLILTRKGTVESEAQLWCTRTRYRGQVPLRSWTKTVTQMRSRWMNKLEAEAVAREYGSSEHEEPSVSPNRRVPKSVHFKPEEKLNNPAKFPTMTAPEVMAVVGISRATVYRFLNEGRLERPGLNKRPGKRSKTLILTVSVKKMLTPSEE